MRGKFIVIEGLDGSGKSTQAKKLTTKLKESLLTYEPTNNNVGSLCRSAFSGEANLEAESILLLLIADRIEHLNKVVLSALSDGKNVICDRYYLSNMAYQSFQGSENTEQMSMESIYRLNKNFGITTPDLTIFLSLAPQKALERIQSRAGEKGIFDDFATLERINSNYQKAIQIVKEHGENVIEVSAEFNEDEIANEIFRAVTSLKLDL
jgi:dTMP kinase